MFEDSTVCPSLLANETGSGSQLSFVWIHTWVNCLNNITLCDEIWHPCVCQQDGMSFNIHRVCSSNFLHFYCRLDLVGLSLNMNCKSHIERSMIRSIRVTSNLWSSPSIYMKELCYFRRGQNRVDRLMKVYLNYHVAVSTFDPKGLPRYTPLLIWPSKVYLKILSHYQLLCAEIFCFSKLDHVDIVMYTYRRLHRLKGTWTIRPQAIYTLVTTWNL